MTQAEKPIAERKRALIAGLLFSVFMTLAFPPIGLWGFAFISISPLVWCAATTKKPLRAALYVGIGSAPFWAFEHRWLIDVTMAGYPFLVLYLSLYAGVFVWIAGRLRLRGGVWAGPRVWFLATAVIWVGLEVFRSRIMFHGYPWFRICYPMTYSGEFSAFVGISGVCLYYTVLASGLGVVCARPLRDTFDFQRRPRKPRTPYDSYRFLWYILVVTIIYQGLPLLGRITLPSYSIASDGFVQIGILQTNVPQSNKIEWSYEQKIADFDRFVDATRKVAMSEIEIPLDLFVWPETMYPGLALDSDAVAIERESQLRFPDGTPTTYFYDKLIALQREIDVPMLIGAIGIDGLRIDIEQDGSVSIDQDALYNSVFLIDKGIVSEQRYDKVHLTPFGEVMPYISASDWLEKQLLALGAQGMSFSLEAGAQSKVINIPDLIKVRGGNRRTGRIATPICFEATIPTVVRRMLFDNRGLRKADLIVQLSNDGWFGDWRGGREQHLQLLQWIAMETRTTVIRAVNTGITTAIKPDGQTGYSYNSFSAAPTDLEPWTEGVVLVGIAIPIQTKSPIYLGNFIDWTTLAFTAFACILPMVPVGSRSDRSGGGAHDSDDASEGTADAHAHPTDSPRTTGSEPDPGGSV